MSKYSLCWWCRSKLRNSDYDNALIWDVRLCCKKCFIERLSEWNAKLNIQMDNKQPSVQPQGYKQLPEASESHITAQKDLSCCGSEIKKENYIYLCGQLLSNGDRIYCEDCMKLHKESAK